MKKYVIFGKNNIILFMLILLLCTLLFLQGFFCLKIRHSGKTDAQRRSYLKSIGITAQNEFKADNTTLPFSAGAFYGEYNSLQRKAGFNLFVYSGEKITVYTYGDAHNKSLIIHLLVYRGEIIGGDISGGTDILLPLKEKEYKNVKNPS